MEMRLRREVANAFGHFGCREIDEFLLDLPFLYMVLRLYRNL